MKSIDGTLWDIKNYLKEGETAFELFGRAYDGVFEGKKTPNQARAIIGLPPVPGGDFYIIPDKDEEDKKRNQNHLKVD